MILKDKILVYTISDLSPSSMGCIDLLQQSLQYRNTDFDFYIVTNRLATVRWWKTIYDPFGFGNYVGWLKYTNLLPDGYDYYIYLDNDILFYEDLYNILTPYSFVVEPYRMSTVWFRYPFATRQAKQEMKDVNGLNAGTFVFKDKQFLESVKSLYVQQEFKSIEDEGKFEQKAFNYAIFREKLSYLDISNLVQLHATEITDKKIYHFCGFDGHMNNKLEKMQVFHKRWIETKS